MKSKHKKSQQGFVLLSALIFFLPGLAQADGYSHRHQKSRAELVVFGDSLSDPGNLFAYTGMVSIAPYDVIPESPYDIRGRQFSNGPTWAQRLAIRMGSFKSAFPAYYYPARLTNFAFGRARARPGGVVPGAQEQVDMYLGARNGVANPNALYVVQFGGNDVRDALVAGATDPSAAAAIVTEAIGSTATAIQALVDAGAQRFLVANAPDVSHAPAITIYSPPEAATAARNTVSIYNGYLEGTLQYLELINTDAEMKIVRLDMFQFINDVVVQPENYGISNVTTPCLSFFVAENAVCEDPDDYLFWDGIHPTRAIHKALAREAAGVLRAARVH